MEHITSRTNPTVRLVRLLLTRRSTRYRERAFVAEGVRAVTTLIERGVPLRAVLLDAGAPGGVPQAIVAGLDPDQHRVLAVEPALFREISDVEEPQPVLAIFDMPETSMPVDAQAILAVDGVQDPGNLGSILRSASASGIDGVLLLPGTVDRYSPKVVRASAGLIGSLPVATGNAALTLLEECASNGLSIVLAHGEGDTHYSAFDWTRPFVLVIGSEASGASDQLRNMADVQVQIPMQNDVESINVAAAAAVLLFEAQRQRYRG